MKNTGELIVHGHIKPSDSTVQLEWTGGRRVLFNADYLRSLVSSRALLGKSFVLYEMPMRVVGRQIDVGRGCDSYVVIPDGFTARIVAWYSRIAPQVANRTSSVEARLFGWAEGRDIPKRSLTGLVLRWL